MSYNAGRDIGKNVMWVIDRTPAQLPTFLLEIAWLTREILRTMPKTDINYFILSYSFIHYK